MLGWSQTALAKAARVSRATVVDFERGVRIPHRNNLTAIREALEAAGIQFIEENGGGAGVRLAKKIIADDK
ncbi:helix-turn-helix transcriptional regulator [Mesorhizobium sp.]|uniref:helix-turn-helix transcriptional regulator n=1 Tax=Mesorhizobium sp. TaxID=1871066 RepID=UPI0039C99D29